MQKTNPKKKPIPIFTIAEIAIVLVISAMVAGSALVGITTMAGSRIRAQVSQIEEFDSATSTFFDKYQGMPGDLLAVQADRYGLEHGDGTPAHSDGDGKISPCNLGWQWNIGCENALFWNQLSVSELISQNFSADGRLGDGRLDKITVLTPYVPESPLAEGIYVTVWNTDKSQSSPEPQLPYGNYYEITKLEGIKKEKLIDNSNAMTPAQAHAIDEKMDDGTPLSGRVLVNGDAHWPDDAWGTFARPSQRSCITADHIYNIYDGDYGNRHLCHLAIAFSCCEPEKD